MSTPQLQHLTRLIKVTAFWLIWSIVVYGVGQLTLAHTGLAYFDGFAQGLVIGGAIILSAWEFLPHKSE